MHVSGFEFHDYLGALRARVSETQTSENAPLKCLTLNYRITEVL